MPRSHSNHSPRSAALLAVALLLAVPAVALAHAEFASSSPADGDVVEGTPAEITADFTDTLADNSTFELRNGAGEVIAQGAIDPENDARLAIAPPDLAPGEYEVRYRAFGEDAHQDIGTFGFTVTAAPSPTPTPPPTPSAQVSAAPATPAPPSPPPTVVSPSPTEGPDTEPTAGTGDVLFPILAAVILVVVLGGYLLSRRRQTPRP